MIAPMKISGWRTPHSCSAVDPRAAPRLCTVIPVSIRVLLGLLLLGWNWALRAEDMALVPLPPRVISTLASIPAMTNRLEIETNGVSSLFASAWRSQDAWSYEQALGFLRRPQDWPI